MRMVRQNKMLILRIFLITSIFILLLNTSFAASRTLYAQEGDFVKIKIEAVDADNDKLTYIFPQPLDERGEWQTDFDDEGEYDLEIIVDDGKAQTIQEIKLIVENTNQAPFLIEKKISRKEAQSIDLKELVLDPDNDILIYTFKSPFNTEGVWQTDYDDAGSLVVDFIVSDGEFDVNVIVEIEILPTNQPAQIIDLFSSEKEIDIEEGDALFFSVEAEDEDGDELTFLWKLDQEIIGDKSKGEYRFSYESAGEHLLKLTISDGFTKTEKEWTINVENENRAPEVTVSPIIVNEGERVVLSLPQVDVDGDSLSYSFELPLDVNGEWQTDYADEGEYELEIIVDDGEFEIEIEIKIIVVNVDHAPSLILPKRIEAKEGEMLRWEIKTADPDNDDIYVEIKNAPAGSFIDQDELMFIWTPDFDVIKRKGGFISNVLNALRLESYFLKSKKIQLEVQVCGRELCTVGPVDLILYNVNRKPVLDPFDEITISETEKVRLEASAIDPDQDLVNYYYSEPLSKKGGEWQTDYDDEGEYTVYVTATDGREGETIEVPLNVLKNNREPTLIIENDDLVVNEEQEFMFKVSATDPDNDNLTIRLDNIPFGASFSEETFIWKPTYEVVQDREDSWKNNFVSKFAYLNKKFNSEEKVKWLEFVASDGDFEVTHPVKVTIKNVNRAPEIVDYLPRSEITVMVNEPVLFHAVAKDTDFDNLSYSWSFNFYESKIKGTNTVERTFVTPGRKKVKVVVSDGREEVEKRWIVNVLEEEYVEYVQEVVPVEPFTMRVYVIEH